MKDYALLDQALTEAVRDQDLYLTQLLIDQGAAVTPASLNYAILERNTKLLAELVRHDATLYPALERAVSLGVPSMVEFILKNYSFTPDMIESTRFLTNNPLIDHIIVQALPFP